MQRFVSRPFFRPLAAVALGLVMFGLSAVSGANWPNDPPNPPTPGHTCISEDPHKNGGACTHYTTTCIARPADPGIAGACPTFTGSMKMTKFRYYGSCKSSLGATCVDYPVLTCAELTFYSGPNCTGMACSVRVTISPNKCLNPSDLPGEG